MAIHSNQSVDLRFEPGANAQVISDYSTLDGSQEIDLHVPTGAIGGKVSIYLSREQAQRLRDDLTFVLSLAATNPERTEAAAALSTEEIIERG